MAVTAPPSLRHTTLLLWAMAAACAVALGLALLAQYAYDMRPCPWCVLQRLIFVAIGLVAAIAALVSSRAPRVLLASLAGLLALAGVASAVYQHNVAAQTNSCNLTFADKVVSGLQLDALLPSVFSATASCAEASVSVFGVPFAYWSLAMFVVLGVTATAVAGRSRRT